MFRLLWATIAALFSGFRSQRGLMLENLALRQQFSTVLQARRPRIGLLDRAFWAPDPVRQSRRAARMRLHANTWVPWAPTHAARDPCLPVPGVARHGGSHDVWSDGERLEYVPRHAEINENLARKILRKAATKKGTES